MNKIWNSIKKVATVTGRGAVFLSNGYANKVKEQLSTINDFEDRYYNLSVDELKKMYETLEGDERLACATLIDKKRKKQNI